jgi:hypothetical protein
METSDFVRASAGLQTFVLDDPKVHVIKVMPSQDAKGQKIVLLHQQGMMKETMAKYLDINNYCHQNAVCFINGEYVFTLRRIASHWQ